MPTVCVLYESCHALYSWAAAVWMSCWHFKFAGKIISPFSTDGVEEFRLVSLVFRQFFIVLTFDQVLVPCHAASVDNLIIISEFLLSAPI